MTAASYRLTENTTMDFLSDDTLCIADGVEVHLTADVPLKNKALVYLEGEEAWLYLDNVRPMTAVGTYYPYLRMKDSSRLSNRINCRAEIYRHGTVVIPQASTYQPLEMFTETNYGGESQKFGTFTIHNRLEKFQSAFRSFKLKKGYMATMAVNSDGTGYSKVFIADRSDIEVPALSEDLDQGISFIRVMPWRWPSKKGWAGNSQSDVEMVQATWHNDWNAVGLDSYLNSEYVPMRHNGGWPSFSTIKERRYATHVLGFNEPNQTESGGGSDMSVDECIAQWPDLLATGLRVGSPAPTDGGRAWILEFIKKCDALNYRVDFIALHFYRGGQSAENFYNFCKDIHDQTGRPIWITEFNNGANWTSEYWPSDWQAQQTEQLRDMKAFFDMLDNAPFVERHSVYNWVEDKRAMILNGALTPAGEMMRDYKAAMAYNPAYAFEPLPWSLKAPEVTGMLSSDRSAYILRLGKNPNGDQAKAMLVEKRINEEDYVQVDSIVDLSKTVWTYPIDYSQAGSLTYRVRYLGRNGKCSDYSQAGSVHITPKDTIQLGSFSFSNTEWNTAYFGLPFASAPTVILGAPTYRNMIPFSIQIKNTMVNRTDIRCAPYQYYTGSQTFRYAENIPFLMIPSEPIQQWGDLCVMTGKSKLSGTWTEIRFPKAFETKPVVFAFSSTVANSTSTAIRIKDVSTTGFKALLSKEAAQTYATSSENMMWMAIEIGTGRINGKTVVVGQTINNGVGTSYSAAATVYFRQEIAEPLFFASLQTANDEKAAIARRYKLTSSSASFFKQAEASKSTTSSKETGAWMVIDNALPDALVHPWISKTDDAWMLVVDDSKTRLLLDKKQEGLSRVQVYNLSGCCVLDEQIDGNELDISALPKGCYLVRAEQKHAKFIK